MKISRQNLRLFCLLAPVATCLVSAPASAVDMRVIPQPIYQVGTSASVYIGHTVDAYTFYNRLYAGGTYNVSCGPPTAPLTGQRFLSRETWGGPTPLVVTIPAWLPSQQTIPGFSSVSPETQLACTYAWTARAVESGYSINLGIVSFQTGNGERSEGGTVPFTMFKPDRTDEGCIKS